MELTTEQQEIINEINNQILVNGYERNRYYAYPFTRTIVGYAGTGKTTLIAELRKQIKERFPKLTVAFLTFTGKASSVLKSKLIDNNSLFDDDYIGTFHSLMYIPETIYDKKLKSFVIVGWKKKRREEIDYDICIIDEASMVSHDLWKDLKSFDKSTICVGDSGQLPPIQSKLNLLANPDFKLTEIHRQALNSPIIKLSMFIRKEGYIPDNTFFSKEVFKLDWGSTTTKRIWKEKINFDDDLIVLCAFNTTRANLNDQIRTMLSFTEFLPYPGEKIVCLKNNHNIKIMNGQIGRLIWLMPAEEKLYRMTIEMDNQMYECLVSDKCFGQVTYTIKDDNAKLEKRQYEYASANGFDNIDFFDYGYCTSVHKAQGSEWEKVVLFEQRTKRWDDLYYAKWLYTAVTRAKEKLFIISDYWG